MPGLLKDRGRAGIHPAGRRNGQARGNPAAPSIHRRSLAGNAATTAARERLRDEMRQEYRERMVRRLEQMVENASSARRSALSRYSGSASGRDIDSECGYDLDIGAHEYKELYDWDAIAARAVEALPKETWQVSPKVYEVEDSGRKTAFEQAWDQLGKGLAGEPGYHSQEEGSAIWEHMLRADIQSGIGHYGVMLLGLDDLRQGDGRSLRSPVAGMEALAWQGMGYTPRQTRPSRPTQRLKLQFLRVFPESLAPVTSWDTRPSSPRNGRPMEYSITFNDPTEGTYVGMGSGSRVEVVHWSRVIHMADNLGSSEVLGMPRLKQVVKRIYDLAKVYGSAGEAFWQSCFATTVVETHPQLGGDVDLGEDGEDAMRDAWEDIRQGLQREILLQGMTAKTLPPQALEPTPWVAVFIEAICIKLGMPKRIFMGSERGELASSQDDAAWNDRIKQRQNGYVTPRIICPFINRCINVGVLPAPVEEDGYKVWWPDLTSKSDLEKADVALKKAQAYSVYISSGMSSELDPMTCLTHVMGEEEEVAAALLMLDEEAEGTEIDEALLDDDDAVAQDVEQEEGVAA